jgi:hypothetical protein
MIKLSIFNEENAHNRLRTVAESPSQVLEAISVDFHSNITRYCSAVTISEF